MIKGAVFTLGLLAFLGFGGYAILMCMAAGMSDSQSASQEMMSSFYGVVGMAILGLIAMVGAFFIPA